MKESPRNLRSLNVRLPAKLYRRLRTRVAVDDIKMAEAVQEALRQYLDAGKQKAVRI